MRIRFVGETTGRPLQSTKTSNGQSIISNLWFNHDSGGRPMVAPTGITIKFMVEP